MIFDEECEWNSRESIELLYLICEHINTTLPTHRFKSEVMKYVRPDHSHYYGIENRRVANWEDRVRGNCVTITHIGDELKLVAPRFPILRLKLADPKIIDLIITAVEELL